MDIRPAWYADMGGERYALCECAQPEADMETHQLLVADKLTVGELMTTAVLALPPLAPVRQVT